MPLRKNIRKIAVIGPNADDVVAQLGDWVFLELMETFILGREVTDIPVREDVVTVLQGIRQRAPQGCQVTYCKGCDVLDSDQKDIAEAVEIAQNAEVAIVVVGDTLAQKRGSARPRQSRPFRGAAATP